jgi:hypothetical protein
LSLGGNYETQRENASNSTHRELEMRPLWEVKNSSTYGAWKWNFEVTPAALLVQRKFTLDPLNSR